MPRYKNDHNDEVVEVKGEEAKRLDTLENWHRLPDEKSDKKAEKDDEEKDE